MRKLVLLLAIATLLTAGCGRKEPPQAISSSEPPQIVSLKHDLSVNVVKVQIQLGGGSNGIGYQIDRAEVDPYCKCPAFWQRYYEEQPLARNAGVVHQQVLPLSTTTEYAYRIRAIDGLGRLGPWSKPILGKAEPSQ